MDSGDGAEFDERALKRRIGKSGDWAEVWRSNVVRLTKWEAACGVRMGLKTARQSEPSFFLTSSSTTISLCTRCSPPCLVFAREL